MDQKSDLSLDSGPDQTWKGPISIYANRLARLQFLWHRYPDGHPILEMEIELVQMAASGLREYFLKIFGKNGIERRKTKLIRAIRELAASKAVGLELSRADFDQVYMKLRTCVLDGVFEAPN